MEHIKDLQQATVCFIDDKPHCYVNNHRDLTERHGLAYEITDAHVEIPTFSSRRKVSICHAL